MNVIDGIVDTASGASSSAVAVAIGVVVGMVAAGALIATLLVLRNRKRGRRDMQPEQQIGMQSTQGEIWRCSITCPHIHRPFCPACMSIITSIASSRTATALIVDRDHAGGCGSTGDPT